MTLFSPARADPEQSLSAGLLDRLCGVGGGGEYRWRFAMLGVVN